MADSELDEIRAKRLAELQSQYGMKVMDNYMPLKINFTYNIASKKIKRKKPKRKKK